MGGVGISSVFGKLVASVTNKFKHRLTFHICYQPNLWLQLRVKIKLPKLVFKIKPFCCFPPTMYLSEYSSLPFPYVLHITPQVAPPELVASV